MTSSLAHMGGLDEIGLFVLLGAGVIFFLRRAERRAGEEVDMGETSDVESPGVEDREHPR